jgi:hypothetical protein
MGGRMLNVAFAEPKAEHQAAPTHQVKVGCVAVA